MTEPAQGKRRVRPPAAPASVLREASEILSRSACSSTFKGTYARMNPAAALTKNVFMFGQSAGPPRAVLWGPYLYFDAPDAVLPPEFEHLDDEYLREKHIGALGARLRLSGVERLRVVRALIKVLAKRRR